MQITPMSEAVGAEVTGIDLRRATDEEFADIRAAFFDRGLLVFRDQQLDRDDHVAFARRWGEIDINRFFTPTDTHPEIAQVLKTEEQTTNIGGGWHTDHSYDQIPAMGSILKAVELPETGGDTLFAGMQAAYDALPDDLRDEIEGLTATHGSAHIFGAQAQEVQKAGDRFGNADAATQVARHPVVLAHPETGRKGIYVNAAFTTGVEGRDEIQSRKLLAEIFGHCLNEEFHVRLKWEPGTVAMWDNRSTWHWALNDYQGQRRYMERITVKGVPLAA